MPSPVRVLMLEDDRVDAELMVRELRKAGFEPDWQRVDTELDYLARLDGGWDLIIADFHQPGFNARTALRLLQQRALEIPFIVVSGMLTDEEALELIKEGAADFLLKDRVARLGEAVKQALERKRLRDGHQQAKQLRTLNDMLEQRLAERTEALLHKTRMLQTVVESMSDGLVVADEHGQFLLWNAAAKDIVGIGATDARPPEWTDRYGLFLPDGKTPYPPDQLPLTRAIRGERVDQAEVFVRNPQRPDGLWLNASARPLQDPTGTLRGGVVVFRDVTEAKWAQAQAAEMRVAREVQQALLPAAAPPVAGFDIHGVCYPALATGGDYFDYIPLRDGSLGIAIGDASGHGFGSALMIAETRAYLRALTLTHTDVGEILTLLNRALFSDGLDGHFVTMLLVRLDPRARSWVYAGAGHPPGYVFDESGTLKHVLDSAGFPLGLDGDAQYAEAPALRLEPGELAFLYTDGVTEAGVTKAHARRDALFGIDRALEVVRANRAKSARDIVDALCHAVFDFAQGNAQYDDICAVVIKVVPTP